MAAKKKLSKSILDMKFMKRTKEKVEKEEEIEETQKLYKQNLNKNMIESGESKYYIEPSYFLCEGLKEGRLSFRGMNVELEKYLVKSNYWGEYDDGVQQEMEIDDEEMAARYQGNKVKQERGGPLSNPRRNNDRQHHRGGEGGGRGGGGMISRNNKQSSNRFNGPPNKKMRFIKPEGY